MKSHPEVRNEKVTIDGELFAQVMGVLRVCDKSDLAERMNKAMEDTINPRPEDNLELIHKILFPEQWGMEEFAWDFDDLREISYILLESEKAGHFTPTKTTEEAENERSRF